jgi:uncharacterized beta-barrel protein YwiB (DUF1934 family)
MKKEVIIAIAGLQFEIAEDEALEVIAPGEYYYRNGKHYVLYEELFEEEAGMEGGITKNTLKFWDTGMELRKSGVQNAVMTFEVGKKTMTCYQMPAGQLMIGIDTTSVRVREFSEGMVVDVRYNLDLNYSFVSECWIKIKIIER